jgi:hypothetical protein
MEDTMTRSIVLTVTFALLISLLGSAGPASAANTLVFEGRLEDASGGTAPSSVYVFDFAVYDAPAGGTLLWSEVHPSVLVSNGRYSITLGSTSPLDLPGGDYWLETLVDGEPQRPRTKIALGQGTCTIAGDLVISGQVGIGTQSPNAQLEVNGGSSEAALRVAWGPQYPHLFGEIKQALGDGLVINSNALGSWAEIRMQTDGNDRMFIKHDGSVGIGTDEPRARLHVTGGDAEFSGRARVGDFMTQPTGATPLLHVHNAGGVGTSFRVSSYSFGTEDHLVVTGNGKVGVGVSSPAHRLHVAGGAYCNGTAWINASSREYKERIAPLDAAAAMAALTTLEPVTYRYKTAPDDPVVGFIAEDVPDLVATADRRGLDALELVAMLTKVVQEQQARLDDLEARLAVAATP